MPMHTTSRPNSTKCFLIRSATVRSSCGAPVLRAAVVAPVSRTVSSEVSASFFFFAPPRERTERLNPIFLLRSEEVLRFLSDVSGGEDPGLEEGRVAGQGRDVELEPALPLHVAQDGLDPRTVVGHVLAGEFLR